MITMRNCGIMKVWAIVTMALSCLCIAGTDSDTENCQRLGILCSKAVQESGLGDLLTVQMQQLPGVELVERDRLRKVLDEIALSMMLGADRSENRRQAGALLKADMLVLLSLVKVEEKKHIQIIISD